MSYVPVKDYDSRSEPDDHLDNIHPRRRPKRQWNYLNIYLSVTTTLLCILLVIDIFAWHRNQPTTTRVTNSGNEFETQFGSDERYMSLDHQYDHLWKEDLSGGEDKIVELGDGQNLVDVEGNDIGSPASISMYACIPQAHSFLAN